MVTKKMRSHRPKRAGSGAAAAGLADALRERWSATLSALGTAEQEVEKQVKRLLRQRRINGREAASMLRDAGARIDRERRKALRELEARVATLQGRLHRDRRMLARMIDDAVQSALAAFNIPSRHEVAALTRKVEELSGKIDGLRGRARVRARQTARKTARKVRRAAGKAA